MHCKFANKNSQIFLFSQIFEYQNYFLSGFDWLVIIYTYDVSIQQYNMQINNNPLNDNILPWGGPTVDQNILEQ